MVTTVKDLKNRMENDRLTKQEVMDALEKDKELQYIFLLFHQLDKEHQNMVLEWMRQNADE